MELQALLLREGPRGVFMVRFQKGDVYGEGFGENRGKSLLLWFVPMVPAEPSDQYAGRETLLTMISWRFSRTRSILRPQSHRDDERRSATARNDSFVSRYVFVGRLLIALYMSSQTFAILH